MKPEILEMDSVVNNGACSGAHIRNRRPSFFVEEGDDIIPLKIIGENNEEILPTDIVVPPDGGWGWVIVFASFMSSIIFGGIILTFGIILTAIIESQEGDPSVSVSMISSFGGCLAAASLFSGPFAAALVNKVGFRTTAILGSFISAFGFGTASYFCKDGINVPALLFFYSILGGIGIGLVFLTSIVTIGFYFEKKRAIATGIAVCGTGVGTFVFPFLLSSCITRFQWQGALLAESALLLLCALFACLYRPLDLSKNSLGKQIEVNGEAALTIETKPEIHNTNGNLLIPNPDLKPKQRPPKLQRGKTVESQSVDLSGIQEEGDEEEELKGYSEIPLETQKLNPPKPIKKFIRMQSLGYINPHSANAPASNIHKRRVSLAVPSLQTQVSLDIGNTRVLRVENNTFNKPMNRNNILYRGSIHMIKEFPQDFGNIDFLANSKWEDESITSAEEREKKTWLGMLKRKLYVVRKMLDVSLLKSQTFILLCLMAAISLIGFHIPIIYLKGIAEEKGCEPNDATLLISIFGLSDMIGRIISGATANAVSTHVIFINNAALVIGGLVTIFVPFIQTFPLFITYSCLIGVANACVQSLRSIILVELLGLEKLTNAFGLSLLCEGVGSLVGSPFAGFLRDSTGSFDLSFHVGGVLLMMAGLICSPIYIVKSREEKRLQINN